MTHIKDSSSTQETMTPTRSATNKSVIESLVSGSLSSTLTTILYQPLDLIKTRIQLQNSHLSNVKTVFFGKATKSAVNLIKKDGFLGLWRGTGASVLRSGPGVGLYYSMLNILQTNYSSQTNRPDDAAQAFYFGLIARSIVSSLLLPVTVVKVRYESGRYTYHSLLGAIGSAYRSSSGWVGLIPTVLRDSIFSGTYYMCYTQMRTNYQISPETDKLHYHLRLFSYGIFSGMLASLVTNPIDVVKTAVQASSNSLATGRARTILFKEIVFSRAFDGLAPRIARRTLISASTWTFYEMMLEIIHI